MAIRSTFAAAVQYLPSLAKIREAETETEAETSETESLDFNVSFDYTDTCDEYLESPIHHLKDYSFSETPRHSLTMQQSSPMNRTPSSSKSSQDSVPETSKHLELYLDEQNEKFDDLINKNLDVVLQQQKNSKDSDEPDITNLLIYVLSSKEPVSKKMWVTSKLLTFTSKKMWAKMGHRVLPPTAPPTEDTLCENELEPNYTIQEMVDNMDISSKKELYEYLEKDLKIDKAFNDANDKVATMVDRFKQKERSSLLDKFEILCILFTRLFFFSLRLAIPMLHLFYFKFINNDLYILNNKNLDKLIQFVVKCLIYLDDRFKKDIHQQGDFDSNALYDEMAQELFGDSGLNRVQNPKLSRYFSKRSRSRNASDEEIPSVFLVAEQFVNELS